MGRCLAVAVALVLPSAWACAATPAITGDEKALIEQAKGVELAIERAAEKIAPAVVNILIMREVSAGPFGIDDPDGLPDSVPEDLREFFERRRRLPRVPFRAQGNGSGFIISSDGYILTSEHVIRDAAEIEVTLSTRKRYRAKVVGSDPRRDLAVIRIDAKDLPVARLGDASTLKRGQFVLALGSPFGFGRDGQSSLSFGIVSGTGRAIPSIGRELDRYYGNLIQTDAAVNPGNSGGPLVNLDGEVVGVNAVISSQTGASDGVGFAIPITASTKAIIERLKRGEEIVYGYIGVMIQEVGEEEAARSGAEAGTGAFVYEVLADGPGARAGIREGDVLVAIGGQTIREPDDVIQIVQATPVGEKITLTVLRKGKRENVSVEVARRPSPEEVAVGRQAGLWWRGMRLEPLTADVKEQIGLKESDHGVFVQEVRDGSPAASAGLIPGMVIDQVGERKVASIKEFRSAVADFQGPCMVHVVGIGVRIVRTEGTDTRDDKGKETQPSDRPKTPEAAPKSR